MSPDWKNDFVSFYNDMSPGYKKGLQIDRIDNNGDYCKGNCRWVTSKANGRNKRNTVYLVIDGEKKTMKEWTEIYGKYYPNVYRRSKMGKGDEYTLFGRKGRMMYLAS